MIFRKGPLFYACFNLRLTLHLLLSRSPDLFIANDLDTLPANFLVSRIRSVKLLYDSHELFTQIPELINRKFVQGIWKWIEHGIVPRLTYAITVSPSIAEIYRRLYGTRFRVVRNLPKKRIPIKTRSSGAGDIGKKVIIYQGAINVGRGLKLMIETMQYVENAIFRIAGDGDLKKELMQYVEEQKYSDQVQFMGRLMPDELYPLTCSADLGISLEEDLGLNYRYALPNKLFDYIQARIPVLCAELPEMARIVDTYGVGISTAERDPKKLAGIIRYMLEERSRGSWKEALESAAEDLTWENESKVYIEVLTAMGFSG